MKKPYEPRGKIVPLINLAKADPDRIIFTDEACRICGERSNKLGGSLTYALRAEVIFRGKINGKTAYRGRPFDAHAMPPPPLPVKLGRRKGGEWQPDPDDLRIPKVVPGWTPPKMVCVRETGSV
jgi:hypothetical protein